MCLCCQPVLPRQRRRQLILQNNLVTFSGCEPDRRFSHSAPPTSSQSIDWRRWRRRPTPSEPGDHHRGQVNLLACIGRAVRAASLRVALYVVVVAGVGQVVVGHRSHRIASHRRFVNLEAGGQTNFGFEPPRRLSLAFFGHLTSAGRRWQFHCCCCRRRAHLSEFPNNNLRKVARLCCCETENWLAQSLC